MSVDYAQLVTDLEGEQAALREVLERLAPEHWELATHAPGWAVRDQVAHLAFFDEAAVLAARDAQAFAGLQQRAAADPAGFERSYLERGRGMTPTELLQWWRRASADLVAAVRPLEARARLPWFGPSMSAASFVTARLMETWSHGLDVVDVVPFARPDTDRLRHVVELGIRTRPYSYQVRGLTMPDTPIRIELRAPSGALWAFGPEDAPARIRGTATDFCRVVTQRRHLADTNLEVEGEAALEWMTIAQAFAGPPGPGRRPGQFPKEEAP